VAETIRVMPAWIPMRSGLSADVVVVGAGPAGAAAAITLCRKGCDVILVDKAEFPRDKTCGDGLTTAALRRVERLGLDPLNVPSWEPVSEVVVRTSTLELTLPFPDDRTVFPASARRADLDAALVDLARQAGARVIEGQAVVGANGETGPEAGSSVSIHLHDGRRLRAPYAIGADGMWSPLRRSLGLGDWQAGRQYFEHVGPLAQRLWVWFEPDMLPGYAWSFPLPGNAANVGYGVLRGRAPDPTLRGQSIDLAARPHIAEVLGPNAVPVGEWRSWPIPSSIGDADLSGLDGRVLFVGDAAMSCDPMTGEGIAQALETGEMAAKAVAWAGPGRPHRAARRYRRQIAWGLAVDDHVSRRLSAVLAHPNGPSRALSLVDRADWRRRQFVRWMFEDYPRAILLTPHRWTLKKFSSPGAYRGAT
jgi:geranylgeranyl reductase family protein